jgi:alpha-L-fucosidase
MGAWLKQNGEAIYGTRPWHAGRPQDRTPAGTEIRYTTRGNTLYAMLLRRPESTCLLPGLRAEADTTIRLLGRGETKPTVPWRQTDAGVELDLAGLQDVLAAEDGAAEKAPQDYAYTLSISPRPELRQGAATRSGD